MKSLWNDADAESMVRHLSAMGVNEDLALRTYSARLLGSEPTLVLHGGGNTSVKTKQTNVFGHDCEVLCIKGSGWDLATIEPGGHPAVLLASLQQLRLRDSLSDEDMVKALRTQLLDPAAPNPSVEALLHAFVPQKFVDHTHSTAILAITNQPDGVELSQRVFGPNVVILPYVMPGFDLAQMTAEAVERHPELEALVLLKHGVFTFGDTARESYERMILIVSRAEQWILEQSKAASNSVNTSSLESAHWLPLLRGALSRMTGKPNRWLLDLRFHGVAQKLACQSDVAQLAQLGVATPDHVIRTKREPFVLAAPSSSDTVAWLDLVESQLADYAGRYKAYFDRHNARIGGNKTILDVVPRVVLVPGLGLIGVGESAKAAGIAADIACAWAQTVLDAQAIGSFVSISEAETFEMEYWSLEQAKLGKQREPQFSRQVVMVTGAASGIGAATARSFAKAGAHVVLLDQNIQGLNQLAAQIGSMAYVLSCDVSSENAVREAFDLVCLKFGGLDIVVSNVGLAREGKIAQLDNSILRQSFELNFFSHQWVARCAVSVMKAQQTGGCILFNVSKQAINPGSDFGAYGTSKAALMALMRQYALEHGADGIRVNAINPDRIRSGLLTDEMISSRSKARGLSESDYMGGNLLRQEVLAEDVAHAFVAVAGLLKTTGAVLTVDGGNVAAMVR